jgi:hypothetical protein
VTTPAAASFTYAQPSPGPGWTVTSFVFTATGATELSLAAVTNNFVLIDSVKVEQVKTKIHRHRLQPEESLAVNGENAFGD